MNTRLVSILSGALAGLALAAPVIYLRHRRVAGPEITHSPPRQAQVTGNAPADQSFANEWQRLMRAGGADAELRAAESCDRLDRAGCVAAAELALRQRRDKKMLRAIICRWAALDGEAAMQWVMRHRETADFEELFTQVAAVWAAKDPSGLEVWWTNDPGGGDPGSHAIAGRILEALLPRNAAASLRAAQDRSPDVEKLNGHISEALMPADPVAAVRVLLRSSIRGSSITIFLLSRGVRDAASAKRVMTQLLQSSDAPMAGDLSNACRRLWAQYDPVGCLEWQAAHAGVLGIEPVDPTLRVAAILACSNPGEAASGVLDRTPEDQRSETLRRLIEDWATRDPDSAGTWLARQPDAPERWAAAAGYAVISAVEDASTAFTWAGSIGDEELRAGTEERVLLKWYEVAPNAAESWLHDSKWPPDRVLKMQELMAATATLVRKS